jgi:DNA primase
MNNREKFELAFDTAIPHTGNQLKIRCCFHSDSTPSLSINIEKGLFNCFGCGEKGHINNFLKNKKHMENLNEND